MELRQESLFADETKDGIEEVGDVIYSQVAHDIRQHVADLLDGRRVELTVSLMEAEPERYATD